MDRIFSNYSKFFTGALTSSPWIMVLFYLVVIWTLIWKGIALWKAARNNHHAWFIVLLVVNTLGILEILYIYIFSKMAKKSAPQSA
jgi:hypothetical protein